MNTIFIGGSRHVSRLPSDVREKLNTIVRSGYAVLVGDAAGADKAVQQFLSDAYHDKVTVFCSGEKYRNNLGHWPTHNVPAPRNAKGYEFYAAKDREMAREADHGFMIWDGKSPGTLLNVLRLVRAGKRAEMYHMPAGRTITFSTNADLQSFFTNVSTTVLESLQARASEEERNSIPQINLFNMV